MSFEAFEGLLPLTLSCRIGAFAFAPFLELFCLSPFYGFRFSVHGLGFRSFLSALCYRAADTREGFIKRQGATTFQRRASRPRCLRDEGKHGASDEQQESRRKLRGYPAFIGAFSAWSVCFYLLFRQLRVFSAL